MNITGTMVEEKPMDSNETTINNHDNELEELVLRESILSATGLNLDSLQISIKGDPSLRETSLERKKYESPVDRVIDALMENLQDILLNRTTYRIFIGFNSGEIRTNSIFDPLRQEIHAAEKMADKSYIDRHFPKITYAEKIEAMRDIYNVILNSKWFDRFPNHWKNIFIKRHKSWDPMTEDEIRTVMSSVKTLRNLPDLYLRNITVCIVQDMIRMQFNCDGTQIISAENYQKFIEQNLPV